MDLRGQEKEIKAKNILNIRSWTVDDDNDDDYDDDDDDDIIHNGN